MLPVADRSVPCTPMMSHTAFNTLEFKLLAASDKISIGIPYLGKGAADAALKKLSSMPSSTPQPAEQPAAAPYDEQLWRHVSEASSLLLKVLPTGAEGPQGHGQKMESARRCGSEPVGTAHEIE